MVFFTPKLNNDSFSRILPPTKTTQSTTKIYKSTTHKLHYLGLKAYNADCVVQFKEVFHELREYTLTATQHHVFNVF